MNIQSAVNLEDMRLLARRQLPRIAFDFIDGGADDELCLKRNREAFEKYRLLPRYLRDVSTRDQSVVLFGRTYASPIGISPTGLAGLWRPGADLMQAAAARDANVPFMLSSAANASLEDGMRVAPEHVWFQMYCTSDERINADLVQRAVNAQVGVLVISVDVPVNSNRERNRRNGFSRPLRMTPGVIFNAMKYPAWVLRYLRSGGIPMMRNWQPYAPEGASASEVADLYGTLTPAPMVQWSHLQRIREAWAGPLVVKGLLHPDDAKLAARMGVDALVVSNHGGRQLDAAPSPLDMLPAIRAALGTHRASQPPNFLFASLQELLTTAGTLEQSTRSHSSRLLNSSGQRCSASTLSRVTVTPSANAASYSVRGAKLGVNSTRRGESVGRVLNTCLSSPCETHSRPKPSCSSTSRMAGCELALIA